MPLGVRQDGDGFANSIDNPGYFPLNASIDDIELIKSKISEPRH
jgi:hypothetical protein